MSTSHAEHLEVAPPRLDEVSAGIYAYIQPDGSWFLNNTGFLVGRKGVISIDTTSTERRTRKYLEAVSSVTSQPVRTLINTHHHGDHTHGNCLLPLATIIGHPAAAKRSSTHRSRHLRVYGRTSTGASCTPSRPSSPSMTI